MSDQQELGDPSSERGFSDSHGSIILAIRIAANRQLREPSVPLNRRHSPFDPNLIGFEDHSIDFEDPQSPSFMRPRRNSGLSTIARTLALLSFLSRPPPGRSRRSSSAEVSDDGFSPSLLLIPILLLGGDDDDEELEAFMQEAFNNGPTGPPPASKEAIASLESITMNYTEKCTVCQDELECGEKATRIPCRHTFHPDCLKPWLEMHNSCPVCRYELETVDEDYNRRLRERQRASLPAPIDAEAKETPPAPIVAEDLPDDSTTSIEEADLIDGQAETLSRSRADDSERKAVESTPPSRPLPAQVVPLSMVEENIISHSVARRQQPATEPVEARACCTIM